MNICGYIATPITLEQWSLQKPDGLFNCRLARTVQITPACGKQTFRLLYSDNEKTLIRNIFSDRSYIWIPFEAWDEGTVIPQIFTNWSLYVHRQIVNIEAIGTVYHHCCILGRNYYYYSTCWSGRVYHLSVTSLSSGRLLWFCPRIEAQLQKTKYWEMPSPGEQLPAAVSPPHTHTHCTRERKSIVTLMPAQPVVAVVGQFLYLARAYALGYLTLNSTLYHIMSKWITG